MSVNQNSQQKFIQTGISLFLAPKEKKDEIFVTIDVSREPKEVLGKRRGRPRKYPPPIKKHTGLKISTHQAIEEMLEGNQEEEKEETEEEKDDQIHKKKEDYMIK